MALETASPLAVIWPVLHMARAEDSATCAPLKQHQDELVRIGCDDSGLEANTGIGVYAVAGC